MVADIKSNDYFVLNKPFQRISIDDINSRTASYSKAKTNNASVIDVILENINEYDRVYENINHTAANILDIIYAGDDDISGNEPLLLNRISYEEKSTASAKKYSSVLDYKNKYRDSIAKLYQKKFEDGTTNDCRVRLNIYTNNIYNQEDASTYDSNMVEILKQVVTESNLSDLNNNIDFVNVLKSNSALFLALNSTLIAKYFHKSRKQRNGSVGDNPDESEVDYEEEVEEYEHSSSNRLKRLLSKTPEYRNYIKQVILESIDQKSEDIEYLVPFFKELKALVSASEYDDYRARFLSKYLQKDSPKDHGRDNSNDIINALYQSYNVQKYNKYLNSIV